MLKIIWSHRNHICAKFVRDLEHYGLFLLTTLDSPHFVILAASGFLIYAGPFVP